MGPTSPSRSAFRAVGSWSAMVALLGAVLVLGTPDASAGSTATGDVVCSRSDVVVQGPGLLHGTSTVAGRLCGTDPYNADVLLITAHGATYNHLYWDWPQSPSTYSFVRNQEANVSILNIDLLGSGESSHPLSLTLTQQAQASMLHQVVSTMRARGFEKIVLVGHSSGSGTIILEASTYEDVDGLIVTGFLHRFAPPLRGQAVPLSMYPAALDPAFANRSFDLGYLTTRPGTRSTSNMFYDLAAADAEVIAYDEAHKDVVPLAHALGFALIVNDPSTSRAVNVPVLSLQGDHDGNFCDSPACPQALEEPRAWSPAAQLELHVIPNASHNIHLHQAAAAVEFSYVREWLDRRFG